MQTRSEKQPLSSAETQKRGEGTCEFADRRPEAASHNRLQALANASPQACQARAIQAKADASPVVGAAARYSALQVDPIQREAVDDEAPLQGQFTPLQRAEADDADVQMKIAGTPEAVSQRQPNASTRPNNTGLPDNLKSGIEALSGMSMDNVKVHYNSSEPAQLNALAYAQGTDIHVGPGQERHLPHEAWHVVQQAQGRVKPTIQMKDGVPVNDDLGLEHEADMMGARIAGFSLNGNEGAEAAISKNTSAGLGQTVQRLIVNTGDDDLDTEFRKPDGWIVASDVHIALLRGGKGQQILEKDEVVNNALLRADENIYLQGHGSPGMLGGTRPEEVARILNQVLPRNYTGQIVSLSCSAGAPVARGNSGVADLAGRLNKDGINVSGAAGVALNHSAYDGDKRVFSNYDANASQIVQQEIDNFGVTKAWQKYIKTWNGDFYEAAEKADQISKAFYLHLETRLEELNYLLPKDRDTTVATSEDESSCGCGCYITTACTASRGLPDDCEELTTLRKFRDEYILALPDGKEMVAKYYRQAPLVVQLINSLPNRDELYESLYGVISFCVKAIRAGQNDMALDMYRKMVQRLHEVTQKELRAMQMRSLVRTAADANRFDPAV